MHEIRVRSCYLAVASLFALTACLGSALPAVAQPSPFFYEFEIVAQEGDTIGGRSVDFISGAALINDNREVAFSGGSGSGQDFVLAVWSTTDLLLVQGQDLGGGVTVPEFTLATFAFNDAGEAAVTGFSPQDEGIYTSTGTVIAPGSMIGGDTISGNFDRNVALADDGTAFFIADVETAPDVFTTTVFSSTAVLAQEGDTIGGVTLTDIGSGGISGSFGIDDAGNAVFFNNPRGSTSSPTAVVSTAGFALEEGSAFPSGPLAGQTIDEINNSTYLLAVNGQGDILFDGSVGGVNGVYSQDGLVIADGVVSGIDGDFVFGNDLNDNGTFAAFFTDFITIDQGIVVDGELVFSELNTIAGLEVDSIDAFSSIDLNNRGDFVFTARLRDDDGNRFSAVIVATLVPEPTSLALLGLGGLLVVRRRR